MPHCEKNCISILLTENCNLNCRYCYCEKNKKGSGSIDIEFCKKGIDDFYRDSSSIYLRFFGNGEPTLQMDIIKELTQYCKDKQKDSIIELQTNGFFNVSICEWIGSNIDIVWISCDGPSEIHDFYRPTKSGEGSSSIVERNIKYLASKVNKVGIRPTIGQKNIYRQIELIDYFESLGVKYIYTDLMFAAVGCGYYEEEISQMEYVREFLKAMRYAEQKGIFYGSFFTMNFDSPCKISCRSCIPSPHLTIDGYVSCCDLAYSNDIFPELIYGKYDLENRTIIYDEKKIKYIQSRTVDKIPQCDGCEIKYYCAGGCLGECLNEKGSIFKIKEENCEAIRFLAKEIGVNKGAYPVFHP